MNKQFSFLTFILLSCIAYHAIAQQDGIRPEDVVVETDYTPVLSDAVKINFPATLTARQQQARFDLFYSTPVRQLQVPFAPVPLKPVAIGKEAQEQHPMSYFKLGFGTQLSPLAEALWTDGKIEKYHYGAFFRHFSSRGSKINHQDFSETEAAVFATYFTKKARLNTELKYRNNAVFYYGYDHAVDTFSRKEVKQRFGNFAWESSIVNIQPKKSYDYDVRFGFNHFSDRFDISEASPWVTARFSKIFKDKHFLTLRLHEDLDIFKRDTTSRSRNIFSVKPVYEFNDQTWRFFGGADFTWEKNIFHLFPELGLERSLYERYIILYNGWRMELQRTSYQTLTEENPWLGNDFSLRNTWFEDRYIGLKGTVKDFTYNVRFAQRLVRRMPLFVNDTTNMKQFEVVYDRRANLLNLHAELFYRVTSALNFSATLEYIHYEMDIVERAWHLPNFKFDFNTQYSIKKKVYLTLSILARDGVLARVPDFENGTFVPRELKGTLDLNLGATYKFSKNFSFFCNLNNLASIKYQRYYLYPSYGFNGMVGVIFNY